MIGVCDAPGSFMMEKDGKRLGGGEMKKENSTRNIRRYNSDNRAQVHKNRTKCQDKTEKEKRGQRKESEETRVGDSREQSARLAASSKICVSYKVT